MPNLRFSRPTARFLGAGLLFAMILAAPSARAAKPLVNVMLGMDSYASVYDGQGNVATLDNGSLAEVFDGDDATCGKIRSGGLGVGATIVVDFPLELLGDKNHLVYADTVALNMAGNAKYSLFFSVNGTDWEPLAGAERTAASTNAVHNVKERIKSLKLVFDTLSGTVELFEFQVWGYVSSVPVNVVLGKSSLAKMYKSDDSLCGDGTGGFGGGSGIGWFFNGYKDTSGSAGWTRGGTWMPHLGNGGYCLIDFTGVMANGYFVTAISISQCAAFKYSLYWTADGTTWNPVEDAVKVSKVGEASYDVNKTATKIKVLFDETGGWTENIAEIEVWGMDPDDVFCAHPTFTEWMAVDGSATCLLPGIDERFCTVCEKRFTREQETGLGHDFQSHLLTQGVYRRFGTGYIDCSRCDWRLDFPANPTNIWETQPLDLVTNRVNGTQIGRVSVKGQFNFTEITVTSTGNGPDEPDPNQNWGVSPSALINNCWGWGWKDYWYSIRPSIDPDPHVDYVFGTEIDLAWIDVSTDNGVYTNLYLSVDDDTGEETLLASNYAFTADETHMESVEPIVFTPVTFAATEDVAPDIAKTYYAVVTNGAGAFYVATNGLESFEADTDYYEISAVVEFYLVLDGGMYTGADLSGGFATNATYVIQSATADKYYTQESSGKYIVADVSKGFSASAAYYRATGGVTGEGLVEVVDTRPSVTRVQLRFYKQPIKHLRVRQLLPNGNMRKPMYISELHPWGTVRGAGDLRYRKETLMIFR